MEHTAAPWHVGMKPGPIIYGPHGETVTHLMILENERIVNCANAAFIVRACNAHEELLTACKNLLTVIVNEDVPQKVLDEAGMLHAAIRKAEGE